MIYRYPPLVEIEWDDACGHSKWFDLEGWSDKLPIRIRTIGFMLQKTKVMIQLAGSMRKNGIVGDLFIIPAGCVVNIRKLKDFDKEWFE